MFLSVILSGKRVNIDFLYRRIHRHTQKNENPFAVSFISLVVIIINPKLRLLSHIASLQVNSKGCFNFAASDPYIWNTIHTKRVVP
jgi:hypothetical protein